VNTQILVAGGLASSSPKELQKEPNEAPWKCCHVGKHKWYHTGVRLQLMAVLTKDIKHASRSAQLTVTLIWLDDA